MCYVVRMKIIHSLALILTSAAFPAIAGQPAWDCLYDGSFEQAIQEQPLNPIILVLNDTRLDYVYWNQWAFQTPEVQDWIARRRIRVVFEDVHENSTLSFLVRPSLLPAVVVFDTGGREIGRRYGYRSSDTPEVFIEWADSLHGVPLHIALSQQLEDEPTNTELRSRVIDELGRAGLEYEQYEHFAWMLDHNARFAEFTRNPVLAGNENAEEPRERDIRHGLLWLASSMREKVGYLAHDGYDPRDGSARVPAISGWQAAASLVDSEPVYQHPFRGDRRKLYTPIVHLRRSLEARRDAGTATERDLFVLTALTGTKGELLDLYESIQPGQAPEKSD